MPAACRPTRRGLLGLALALVSWTGCTWAADSIYVVISAQSPVTSVSKKEVVALFTGRSRTLADGTSVTPIDQARDGDARAGFYQALTGLDIARINSYWARLHFTGQVQPPEALADNASILQRLRVDPYALGYVSREPSDPAVRVLMRLP